jgi:hypothetical protein
MSEQRLLALVLKVLGVWTLIGLIQYIGSGWFIGMISQMDRSSVLGFFGWFLAILTPIIFSGAISYVLLRYADVIAVKLSPSEVRLSVGDVTDYDRLFTLGLQLIGVVMLVRVLSSDLIPVVFNILSFADDVTQEFQNSASFVILRVILQLVLGVYLLKGGPGLAEFADRDHEEY